MRLDNLPDVYWLSTPNSVERQTLMKKQFEENGIKNHNMVYGPDFDEPNFDLYSSVTGPYFHQIAKSGIIITISHLKMIKQWITQSTSEYAVFFEDDISFEACEYWSFNWNDAFERLPKNWKAIQMCVIRDKEINEIKFKPRSTTDWSVAAYMLHRSYGEQIVKSYCLSENKYNIHVVGDSRAIPHVENIVYFMAEPDVYILPIFTENVNVPSNQPHNQDKQHKVNPNNLNSAKYVMDWWKFFGKTTSIKNIIDADDEIDWNKSLSVIGTAVVNSADWVKRLLLSVDYPVENFLIINNNGRGQLDDELEKIKNINTKYIKKLCVLNMPQNLGVAASWNLIIKCYLNAPYWIILNDDVAFTPVFLKEMHDAVSADDEVHMVHGYGGDFGDGAWDLFLIRDKVINEYGLFDENTYPAYCEDADYIMRFVHKPIKKINSLKTPYYHGPGIASEYYTHGSQTKKKAGDELFDKLTNINIINFEYLTKKWGPGWRSTLPTKLPFENENIPISYTSFDLDFIRKKHLGF
jgi:GT2 family glycosyltransferase